MSSKKSNFICVLVPANDTLDIKEISLSKSGGLEKDALRIMAEETFSNDETHTLDATAQQEATMAELVKNGMEADRVKEVMTSLMGNAAAAGGNSGKPRLGSSVEIVCVGLATPRNHYRGVSCYCDANASFKSSLQINKRATRLVQGAGHADRIIYGDCYFGRAHDDESCEWERLDFTRSDADVSLTPAWVSEAASENQGKNMSKYTTSGSLQSYANSIAGKPDAESATPSSSTWTQSNDEVEVRYPLPPTITAKHLNVTITRKSIQITIKSTAATPDLIETIPSALQTQPRGLYDAVVVGDSTWCVEGGKGGVGELVITLSKATLSKWPDVFE